MIDKSKNDTRYNTDDLNNLLEEMGELDLTFPTTDYRGHAAVGRVQNKFKYTSLGYATPSRLEAGNTRRSKCQVGLYTCTGTEKLSIANVKYLAEIPELQLAMLGAAGAQILPSAVVVDIVGTCLGAHNRWRDQQASKLIAKAAHELSEKCQIRIMPTVESGKKARKPLTRDEKIQRLQSDSFYGPGGVLDGPRWAYRSGNRAATGQWTYRINEARRYYEIELDHRNGHAAKLKALGVEPTPYQSFAEFLRDYADALENNLVSRRRQ